MYPPSWEEIGKYLGRTYQYKYSRGISRAYDISKLYSVIGEIEFEHPRDGLKRCLTKFLEAPSFNPIWWKAHACYDNLAGEHTSAEEFHTVEAQLSYQKAMVELSNDSN